VGMSVVGPGFEKLKRFNIDELRQIPQVEAEVSTTRIKISVDE
jgi:tRNA acetyltransferase TAN1